MKAKKPACHAGTIVTITPEKAQRLMDAYAKASENDVNKKNRRPNPQRVADYAAAMAAGKWMVNGETIKLDEDGIIIDGQHRLLACIKSGVPFQTIIVRNVPRDSFDTIDVGNIRTATQMMTMRNIRYASNVIAIINGTHKFMETMPLGGIYATKCRIPARTVREKYSANSEGYDAAAEFASKYHRTGVLSQKLLGTLHYYLINVLHQDPEEVSAFLINITFDDTVPDVLDNNLRKHLFALKGLPFMYDRVRLSMIVHTWNAKMQGLTSVKLPNCDRASALNLNADMPQFEVRA